MKDKNLAILLGSCILSISDELQGAVHDYLMKKDVDLNELNVNDLFVNYIKFIDLDEYDEENHYKLLGEVNGVWVI